MSIDTLEPQAKDLNSVKLFWITLALVTMSTGSIFVSQILARNKAIEVMHEIGKRSTAHQFAVDKYLDCRSEFLSPSPDACVARVLELSKVKGGEFEASTAAAIRDLNLLK